MKRRNGLTRYQAMQLLNEGYIYIVKAFEDYKSYKKGDIVSKHKNFESAYKREEKSPIVNNEPVFSVINTIDYL